jgi:putative ABC transport system ATP-binding protein
VLLEARQVSYRLDGQQVLPELDLSLAPGERLAVVGPSGSGKTTLLSILGGLLAPSTGQVLLDGAPLSGPPRPGDRVAFVLQGYGLVSLLTAAENVEVALRAGGAPAATAVERADQALTRLGLAPHADQLVDELSGGQQQRTAVARALALAPRLLLADEPTAELDPVSRAVVLEALLSSGAAVVMATHDPDVAERCDRSLQLR